MEGLFHISWGSIDYGQGRMPPRPSIQGQLEQTRAWIDASRGGRTRRHTPPLGPRLADRWKIRLCLGLGSVFAWGGTGCAASGQKADMLIQWSPCRDYQGLERRTVILSCGFAAAACGWVGGPIAHGGRPDLWLKTSAQNAQRERVCKDTPLGLFFAPTTGV